jgi:molybdopterin-guanine dinucleotide biosynthesis protein A
MINGVTISILCGGKSSRMQTEKGLVLYQGKPFIEWIIEVVLPISSNIQLITNSNDYDYLKYKKIQDTIADKGPIGGIYTALTNATTEFNLIFSCDIPLLSTKLVAELIQKHENCFDASVFSEAEKVHPLIGVYNKSLTPFIKQSIEENQLKMMDLLSKINCQRIAVTGKEAICLQNINTILELNELNTNIVQDI